MGSACLSLGMHMQVACGTSMHTGRQRLPICTHAESVNLQFTGANCIPPMPAHIYTGTKQSPLNSARMNAGT